MAGSAFSRCRAPKFTTWSLKGVVGTLGTYRSRGLRTTWELPGPNFRHESLTENACRSPTLLIKANAVRSTVFNNSNLRSTYCRGSKSSSFKAIRTEGRYQEGTRWGPVDLTSSPLWGNWWPSSASPQTYRLLHRDVRQHTLWGWRETVSAPTKLAEKRARPWSDIYGGLPAPGCG